MRSKLTASALTIATATLFVCPLSAQPPASTSIDLHAQREIKGDVSAFDVAGVKLGMTPQEARAALLKGGFTPRETDPIQDSWQSKLSQEISKRRNTPVVKSTVAMFTMASGPRGERIEVWYRATPEGARASSVSYSIPTNQIERSSFASGLIKKYGSPTTAQPSSSLYCSRNEKKCVNYYNKDLPYLETSTGFDLNTVKLLEGIRASENYKLAMSSAVEASAPKNAAPSF